MAVSWPGVIKAGTTCEVPVNSMDFFPTFVHAGGGSTSEIKQLEGLDLQPVFAGGETLDRDGLFWHFPHNRMEASHYMGATVVAGDWKFYKGHGLIEDKLWNLKSDPMEQTNVLAKNPEVAKDLEGKLDQWLKKVSAKMPKAAATAK